MFELSSVVEWAAALATISTACGLIVRAVTKDVARDVADNRREIVDLKHTLKNQAAKVEGVEHQRTKDVERIVKLESAVQNFDKAIERVERGQDKLTDTISERFDMLAESIREIRVVAPKL